MVDEDESIDKGKILVKIPRKSAKSGDITGGLPRVTELFEARNPSNPAVVSEIDGVVSFGKIKRGNREIIVESKFGDIKKYLVKLSNQILVQENDFIKAGMPLSDGAITPTDILNIKGPSAVQQYLVNEVQEVYRLHGVKINDNIFNQVVASNGGADSLLTRIPNDEDVEMLESNPTAENIVNYVKTISKKTENIMKDEYYIVTKEDTDNNPFIKVMDRQANLDEKEMTSTLR